MQSLDIGVSRPKAQLEIDRDAGHQETVLIGAFMVAADRRLSFMEWPLPILPGVASHEPPRRRNVTSGPVSCSICHFPAPEIRPRFLRRLPGPACNGGMRDPSKTTAGRIP